MPQFFHQLVHATSQKFPDSVALLHKEKQWTYQQLSEQVNQFSQALTARGIQRQARVVVYLAKQVEQVIAMFGTVQSGGVIVPASPQLKSAQLIHILKDSDADFLITTAERLTQLMPALQQLSNCPQVILTNPKDHIEIPLKPKPISWAECMAKASSSGVASSGLNSSEVPTNSSTTDDLAALLYTSGSTGKPKGVMLSHNNLVIGAKSVAHYLNYTPEDRLLAVLPFSFDYGLSQLTTAFLTGASVVLMDYLLPRDVIRALVDFDITGLAAVPPLWIQLSKLTWPEEINRKLRFITNSGGSMPQPTLATLRDKIPDTEIFLMYGLTEAFRSTFLPPKELDARPTSMGKAIPFSEVFVVRDDGSECDSMEHGELVHAGPLVSLGYWQNQTATNARFRSLPAQLASSPQLAVWSGDTVYKDDDGFLFFVGRKDAMIKSSGYRISPSEIEDVVMEHPGVKEVVAIGTGHPQLGQAVVLALTANDNELSPQDIKRFCASNLPNYMQPQHIEQLTELPRNANGKFDRSLLEKQYSSLFMESQ